VRFFDPTENAVHGVLFLIRWIAKNIDGVVFSCYLRRPISCVKPNHPPVP